MSDYPFLNRPSLQNTDHLPVRGTSPDMLDLDKVAAHIERAVARGRYSGPTEPVHYLLHKQCLVAVGDEIYATLAGILCFGHNPQMLFPRAVVDIGHYHGTETISFEVVHLEKDIGGTIFDQIERVESYLWTNTHHGMRISDSSSQRIEVHEYPRVVIRELDVNMLAHRDYTNNEVSAARVQLFRNRIEWVSPGGLPPPLTVDTILTGQASRNPVILSILYEAGYVEAFGQGLDTVVAVLQREEMSPPKFEDFGPFFQVTVFGRTLDSFSGAPIRTYLSDSQRKILTFIRTKGAATPREIMALFDNRARRSIQRDIRGLVKANQIYADGEGRALRYRPREPML